MLAWKSSSLLFALIAGGLMELSADVVEARQWTDQSGKFQIEATVFARDDAVVVLEKDDTQKTLISVKIESLSDADKKYLLETEEEFHRDRRKSLLKPWHLSNGLIIHGAVIDFVHRDLAVERRRGRAYVNDRPFQALPAAYRDIVKLLAGNKAGHKIASEAEFRLWIREAKGETIQLRCDGVLLELESGDLYPFPFESFKASDAAVLRAGWKDWIDKEHDKEAQRQASLHLQAEAAAYERSAKQLRQVNLLRLQMQEYNAGVFDYWQVEMVPKLGGRSQWVIIPARTSSQAQLLASRQYPAFQPSAVAKLWRRH